MKMNYFVLGFDELEVIAGKRWHSELPYPDCAKEWPMDQWREWFKLNKGTVKHITYFPTIEEATEFVIDLNNHNDPNDYEIYPYIAIESWAPGDTIACSCYEICWFEMDKNYRFNPIPEPSFFRNITGWVMR